MSQTMSRSLTNQPTERAIHHWLPPLRQIMDVVRFRFDGTMSTAESSSTENRITFPISMRQGLGLVIVTALIAGLLPFVVNWVIAGQSGTALPLAQLARSQALRVNPTSAVPLPIQAWREAARTIAGLHPWLPGWLAAGLSSLGVWLNQPLNWLSAWLVYGLGVLVVGKLFGATTTLQRFYAATSYAYVPLVLTVFQPIPYLGVLISIVAWLWAFMLYIRIVQLVTGLDMGRAAISVLLPGAVVLLVMLIVIGALAISLLRLNLGI